MKEEDQEAGIKGVGAVDEGQAKRRHLPASLAA
jgi:hypothetical protein